MASKEGAFKIVVITPMGVVAEDETEEATLPSVQGQIGVLPLHCRYVGLLEEGEVRYHSARDNAAHHLHITGGFSSFADSTLTLLVDSVTEVPH